jgi:periplasmic protein TonB
MNKGKVTCDVLKEIRKQIATENHIDYQTHECTFEGECRGTCPACESEVHYLENEIVKKKYIGKAIVLAGLSVGLLSTLAGCDVKNQDRNINKNNNIESDILVGGDYGTDSSSFKTPIDTLHPKCSSNNENSIRISLVGDVVSLEESPQDLYLSEDNLVIDDVSEEFPPARGKVETMSGFPGGQKRFYEYIKKEIKYPEKWTKDSISGVVLVEFIIDKNGNVTDVKALNQLHPDLDAEAIRVIQNFPKWIPGSQYDKPLSKKYVFPVPFSLSDTNLITY